MLTCWVAGWSHVNLLGSRLVTLWEYGVDCFGGQAVREHAAAQYNARSPTVLGYSPPDS